MRELSLNEIEMVSGGIPIATIRFIIGQGARPLAKAVLSERHSDGDACDYYNNLPAGVQ